MNSTKILDNGYVELIEVYGSDARIIEAARMSTGKGFLGWGPIHVEKCSARISDEYACSCNPEKGDEKLLAYLYKNRHMTPFEMAGAVFEIKAPIFVFREWHRHRTQSYNEMSARYIPLPDENYMPTKQRIVEGVMGAAANRQAQGAVSLDAHAIDGWLEQLEAVYAHAQSIYERGLNIGVPKEIARLPVPVARYSRMRVSANLRNWLQFLELRDTQHAPGAQYEIRQFADAVGTHLERMFPRTMALFKE